MDRRKFIKRGALLVPAAFSRMGLGQAFTFSDQAFNLNAVASGGAAPCTTAREDFSTGGTTNSQSVMNSSSTRYTAQAFTASATYTACAADIYCSKTASPTFNLTLAIFTDSAGSPGTLVGSRSNAVAASALSTTDGTLQSFTGLSASLVSGTAYWLILECSANPDVTNFIEWERRNVSTTIKQSADESSWATLTTSRRSKMIIYSA